MSNLRDHEPIVIDEFNGLWRRGDVDNTPLDHFSDCLNVRAKGAKAFGTRDGIGISQDVAVPLSNVKRIYNYPTPLGNTLIVLTYNAITGIGSIHHVVNSTTTYGPLLSIAGMTDFAFVPYAGRGYISPFASFTVGDLNVEKGLQNQFLYVYAGDGTAARKAAGVGLTGALTIANGAAGHTDPGLHIFAFVSETISGYLSPPTLMKSFITASLSSVSFGTVPASGDPNVVKRHLVATKKISGVFNGDLSGYQFYFVPNAFINNNTDLFLNNISFYDADLLDDASHLFDNYTEIPAGAVLTIYRNRLVLCATYTDISLALVSTVGEPEAIDQIEGLLVVPLDGNPITNAQELRDVLYVFKRSRTGAYMDNDGPPSSWNYVSIDTALGCPVHGIATVLDSGGSSIDFLIVATYQGISLFNGRYIQPELSWKIEDYWHDLDRNEFRRIQMVNAPIQKEIYCILPDRKLLCGNYANGMDPKKIKWWPWSYDMGVCTIAIVNIDEIIIGADLV
jgi:hypothetical protein